MPRLRGKGWIERKCLNPDEARVCPHCNEKECPSCHGSGQIDPHRRAGVLRECDRTRRYPPPENL